MFFGTRCSSSQNVVALIRAGDTGCIVRIETRHVLVACISVTRVDERNTRNTADNGHIL